MVVGACADDDDDEEEEETLPYNDDDDGKLMPFERKAFCVYFLSKVNCPVLSCTVAARLEAQKL